MDKISEHTNSNDTNEFQLNTSKNGKRTNPVNKNPEINKTQQSEDTLLHLFLHCGHFLHHRKGNHHGQERILSILQKNNAMIQRDLQDFAQIQSASLSELLIKLEENGSIIRKKNEKDKRNINVILTDHGQALAQKSGKRSHQEAVQLFNVLTNEEKEMLQHILQKLFIHWSNHCPQNKNSEHRYR